MSDEIRCGFSVRRIEATRQRSACGLAAEERQRLWRSTAATRRVAPRLRRNFSAAHFPIEKRLEDFEFDRVTGIGKSSVANLADCSWIDRRENVLFFGPPGVGRTHLAIGLGLTAIDRGYIVCFERVNSLMRLLKIAQIQRTSEFRLRRILKSNLLIIDEIGYTPIDRKEANHLCSLVSELHEKSSVVITSNKSFDAWAEMLGDEVMMTAMHDRLHHAQIFTLDGDSYRLWGSTTNKEETDHPEQP